MANPNPTTTFSYEALSQLSTRLWDAAEDIADDLGFEPLQRDLKLAARALSKFASLRYRITEIAMAASTPAVTRVALVEALTQTGSTDSGKPAPEQQRNGGLVISFYRDGEIPEIVWAADGHAAAGLALVLLARRVILCPNDKLICRKANDLPADLPEPSRASHMGG